MAWKHTLGLLAALLAPAASFAAPVTLDYTFSGSNFVDELGSATPPSLAVSGSFRAVFDLSTEYDSTAAGLSVRSLTGLTSDSPVTFSYFPSDHSFYLGGSANGADGTASGTTDFMLTLDLTDPYHPQFVTCANPINDCGRANGNASVLATDYTRSSFPNSGFFLLAANAQVAVPEPGSMTIVLGGLALLGVAGVVGRRHRGAI